MSIAVRIVTVPERAPHARSLAGRFAGELVVDEEHTGTFPTHLRALASAGTATHVLVLEDDALPCDELLDHADALVAERPTHLIGLYIGKTRPARIQHLLASLANLDGWLDDRDVRSRLRWAVGYVMPVVDIPAVLGHLAAGSQHPWLNTDVRIGAWHAARERLSYALPSHVDHDDSIPSTTGGRRAGRTAWRPCAPSPAREQQKGATG